MSSQSIQRPVQRRSKLFVDWQLQGSMIRRILLHWTSFVVVGTGIACLVRWMTHPTVPLGEQAGDMLAQFGPFLVTMFALLPVFVLDTIKLTNRFAGPFVRFRRHLQAIRAGESPRPLIFRDGDYWRETEDDLNAVFAELASLRQEVEELNAEKSPSTKADAGISDLEELAAAVTGLEIGTLATAGSGA